MALNRYTVTNDTTITWPATWSEVVNGPAAPAVTTPAVPASGTAQYNNSGVPVLVTVTGGTVSAITVSGTATGLTSGSVEVQPGGTIAITYTVAPTWTWAAFPSGFSGAGETIEVGTAAPAGGQAGVLPQTTFLSGTSIVLDPAGALFAAIGAGNLTAFRDGTDNVGHAALSN